MTGKFGLGVQEAHYLKTTKGIGWVAWRDGLVK